MRELEYLHDATLIGVRYDFDMPDKKNLNLTIKYDIDTGDSELDGKTLHICAIDVIWWSYVGCGYVLGKELVDRWVFCLSEKTRHRLNYLLEAGVYFPEKQITVTFHSGSVLEFICHKLTTNIISE